MHGVQRLQAVLCRHDCSADVTASLDVMLQGRISCQCNVTLWHLVLRLNISQLVALAKARPLKGSEGMRYATEPRSFVSLGRLA